MEEVDDLVVTPFKEIVDKAKTAVENAGDSNPSMRKAARALLKEGERGLKRIEPLCKKHFEDYGSNFIASLKENDEIAQYRSGLTDLLWEFDDYIEPDDFDAEKFTELQALSRKAAPRICDILLRMKLEAPVSDAASSRGSIAQMPTPTSPPLHLLPTPPNAHRAPGGGSLADIHDATAQLSSMVRSTSGSTRSGGHDHVREPPRPPSINPWDWQVNKEPSRNPQASGESDFEARGARTESPVLPPAYPNVDTQPRNTTFQRPASTAFSVSDHGDHDEEQRLSMNNQSTISDRGSHNYQSHPGPRQRQSKLPSFSSSIPENEVSGEHGPIPFFKTTTSPYSPSQPPWPRQASSPLTAHSDVPSEEQRLDPASLPLHYPQRQNGSFSDAGLISTDPESPRPIQPALDADSARVLAQMDAGPIPVETENAPVPKSARPVARPVPGQGEGCKIESDSSFHLSKGFCEGARDVIRGGVGVRRVKKPGFATQTTVARCIECAYELDFADIEADVSRREKANSSKTSGISFRLRFLQKSHIAARRVDDVQYGCLFCVQQDSTLHKSDATVFFTQKALFDHLARHPRPLPEVRGLTVIEGETIPEKYHNDYDIHFKRPPVPHPAIENMSGAVSLPSGISREVARRLYGQRLLPDRTPALEVAEGARITGIRWPAQYQGEWILGWHNGIQATIPSEVVKLELPPRHEIKYDRSSLMCAKAKWKFYMKEKDKGKNEWLRFDKNEIISNISWFYSDHWCWSGTNSKGKSGIFPQAFVDTNTLAEPSVTSTRAGSVFEEKVRSSSSMMSKFSIRKPSGRPPSMAGSTTSH